MTTTTGAIQELNELSVDFLILADRAEALNGKLYVMGGAWDRVFIADFQQPATISFAVGVLVPWNATNMQHTLVITVVDPDENPIDFRAELGFVVGRPPWAHQGETQRAILALPAVPVRFPQAGTYVLSATLDGVRRKRVDFVAVDVKAGPLPPQSGGQL